MEDLIKPHCPSMSEARATLLSKILAFSYGLLCLAMAYAVHLMNSSVLQVALSIFGMVGGPLLGLFCLGIFFPLANSTGAVTGLVTGLIVAFWVGIGGFVAQMSNVAINHPHNGTYSVSTENMTTIISILNPVTDQPSKPSELHGFYSLSYMWYSALNSTVVVLIGLLVSLLTGPMTKKDVTAGTIYPLLDNICFFLPNPKLCCGSSPEQRITTHCEQMNGVTKPEENTGTDEERESFLALNQRSYLEKETSV